MLPSQDSFPVRGGGLDAEVVRYHFRGARPVLVAAVEAIQYKPFVLVQRVPGGQDPVHQFIADGFQLPTRAAFLNGFDVVYHVCRGRNGAEQFQ